jgi:hypothetical protein
VKHKHFNHDQLCEQALVNMVSASVTAVKRATIVTGFQCCGYDIANERTMNAQLQKAMTASDGLLEISEIVNYVGEDWLDDDDVEMMMNEQSTDDEEL